MSPLIENALNSFEKNLERIADSNKATDIIMWVIVYLLIFINLFFKNASKCKCIDYTSVIETWWQNMLKHLFCLNIFT